MASKTKQSTSFADVLSFCNDTKSDGGISPVHNHSEGIMDTLSLRSKSPSAFSGEGNAWTSPVQKEALELSSRKRNAVLNMIEKNWKINIRTKIESDLTSQVQEALAPLTNLKRRSEKKKSDRQKNLQIFKVNNYNRSRYASHYNNQSSGSSFKYIDVNYIPQSKFRSGRSDGFYTKDSLPKALSNLRLPKRNEVLSQSMYQFDELARARKHASNIRGGLDVTLLDSNSSVDFLPLAKPEDGQLRPLVPNAINYNGISLPNYGNNRRCFQTYTKEGMNNLLGSRARRNKLTQLDDGRFMDKRGVIISRLGPFWPQGYGPVCPCPEFITSCPREENLWSISGQSQVGASTTSNADASRGGLSAWPCKSQAQATSNPINNKPAQVESANIEVKKELSITVNNSDQRASIRDVVCDDVSTPGLKQYRQPLNNDRIEEDNTDNVVNDKPASQEQEKRNLENKSDTSYNEANTQEMQKSINQSTPREAPVKLPTNQTTKRPGQASVKPAWKGKPVIYDCDRSSRSPLPHSVAVGMDESLVFESRFESGNLRQVRRIGEFEYELVLRTDMYTNRHTQWFYFRMQKAKPNRTYKFNIINFLKKDSLYNYGMKPLVYSEKLASNYQLGWHRIGEKIRYSSWSNPTRNTILSLDLQYYCLEFEATFDWEEIDDDTVYLAHCYPYTYSDLRRHLDKVMSNPDSSVHVKREVLCETSAGNACFLLTITDFPDREKDKYKDFHQEKKGVVITARVHPGETQASWMMKGVIEHLVSDHPMAQQLRRKFVFKIVPMLNPDGVIVGNYRTSLAARDLNRNYRHPRQGIFPTIWHTKQMVDQFNKDHPIILYCDLHGHSRKHMVFMYGCERKAYYQNPKNNKKQNGEQLNKNTEKPASEKAPDPLDETRDFVEERLFPWLMHKLAPTRFSFDGTKFAVRRSKEATGRVVMFRQMGIWNSFTMEASFSGTRMDKGSGRHFNIDDFQLIGRKLCDCVLEYSMVCENPIAKSRAILEMTHSIAQKLLRSNQPPTNLLQEPVDQSKNIVENKQTNKRAVQRSGINGSVANAVPNLANIKSTIAKQVRRSQNKNGSNPQKELKSGEVRDVTSTRHDDDVIEIIPTSSVVQRTCDDANNDVQPDNDAIEDVDGDDHKEGCLDENCLRLLQSLNVHQIDLESETSSESNSDSEPELSAEVTSSGKLRTSVRNSSGGKKKKKKKRQQKYGKSISAPSKIQSLPTSKRLNEDLQSKESKSKNNVANYPGYVNKYANRSNGGIPIFSQERMEERAARRLAELRLVEKNRRNQENQLREQLLLAGIQDGPQITYDMSMSRRIPDESTGYSDVCGVRYKVSNHSQKVHYMLSNPYRGNSPSSTNERQPVVTMRFSPPSKLRHNPPSDASPSHQSAGSDLNHDLYMPYRVQAAAGRLSNQRGLSTLTELSGSLTDSNPTEPSSSQSSDRGDLLEDGSCDPDASPVGFNKMEPRSVVIPLQKYNVSFNMYRKAMKRKTGGNVMMVNRSGIDEDLDLLSVNHDGEQEREHPSDQTRPPNVSELVLPPNMDATEVLTAHTRYPAQIHRIEAMRPLPRGRTISRGPPMVFGEPAPFQQKSQENVLIDPHNGLTHVIEKSLNNSFRLNKHKLAANQKQVRHDDVAPFSIEAQIADENMTSDQTNQISSSNDNSFSKQNSPRTNPQSLFVPRFVALTPQRVTNDGSNGRSTDRPSGDLPPSDLHPHTAR